MARARGAAGALLWVLTGCSLLTDAGPLTTAAVEVDPTPVRTIQYPTPNGWSEPEVTTKRLDEIECLRVTPACSVSEGVSATIHNTGTDRLEWHWGCDFPLEEFGAGAWHASHLPCLSILVRPLVIAPGERHTFSIRMSDRHAGEYRVSVNLRDAIGMQLPEDMRISEPFHYQPPSDRLPFSCPTASEVERAGRLAREALDRAARNERPWHPDDQLLRLEHAVPGIGGVYATSNRLVVWVTDEARFAAAEAAVQAAYGREAIARKGSFAFSEIIGWRDVVGGYVGQLPGYYSLDADEGSNRVGVGMSNPLYLPEVACIARGIGMPIGILEVEVGGAVTVFE